jgi:hypothetical protein
VRDISDLEESRTAAGVVVDDPEFAAADCAVADDAMRRHDQSTADRYYRRAIAVGEAYAAEGGSASPATLARNGGQPDAVADRECGGLMKHAEDSLQALAPVDRDDLAVQSTIYASQFDIIVGEALEKAGDIDGARASYTYAVPGLLALPVAANDTQISQASSLSHVAQTKLEGLDKLQPLPIKHSDASVSPD